MLMLDKGTSQTLCLAGLARSPGLRELWAGAMRGAIPANLREEMRIYLPLGPGGKELQQRDSVTLTDPMVQ